MPLPWGVHDLGGQSEGDGFGQHSWGLTDAVP